MKLLKLKENDVFILTGKKETPKVYCDVFLFILTERTSRFVYYGDEYKKHYQDLTLPFEFLVGETKTLQAEYGEILHE